MGLLQFENDHISLTRSPLETQRFGLSVDRLSIGRSWQAGVRSESAARNHIKSVISDSQADIVIARYPAEQLALASALQSSARAVLPSGSLMYWEHSVAEHGTEMGIAGNSTLLPLGGNPDPEMIRSLIETTFMDYVNHYLANPLLDPKVVSSGYVEWAMATAIDPTGLAFLFRYNGAPAGLATVRPLPDQGSWEVELAGVSKEFQGRGLYRDLFLNLLIEAKTAGVERVVISTQSHNVRVQRVWARLGLRPFAAIDSAHLVLAQLLR